MASFYVDFGVEATNGLCMGSFEALGYSHNVHSLCFERNKFSDMLSFRCF